MLHVKRYEDLLHYGILAREKIKTWGEDKPNPIQAYEFLDDENELYALFDESRYTENEYSLFYTYTAMMLYENSDVRSTLFGMVLNFGKNKQSMKIVDVLQFSLENLFDDFDCEYDATDFS